MTDGALHFELLRTPPSPIDASPLTPDRLRGLDVTAIEKQLLDVGHRAVPAGELFRVTGSCPDVTVFAGDCTGLHRIGAGLSCGRIVIEGDCGDDLGVAMTAGEIRVNGNAGARVAARMRGGSIEVFGNTGDGLAAPQSGERSGMCGGRVYVAGNTGNGAGRRLRRGLLVIAGSVGDYCGAEMVAGTLVAAQGARAESGWQTLGQAMRRGSILLPRHPSLSAARFTHGQSESLGFLRLLAGELSSLLPGFAAGLRNSVHRCIGDRSVGGLGELILLEHLSD